jgi:hypothetical protein
MERARRSSGWDLIVIGVILLIASIWLLPASPAFADEDGDTSRPQCDPYGNTCDAATDPCSGASAAFYCNAHCIAACSCTPLQNTCHCFN